MLTVKAVDGLLSHVSSDSSIYPLVFVSLILQEVFKQVEHFGHLGENQDSVASFLQLLHHLLKQHELA